MRNSRTIGSRFIGSDRTRNGQIIRLNLNTLKRYLPTPSGGGSTRYIIKSTTDDYLVCRTWDGTTEGDTDVNVAKPWLLQKTPHDGISRGGFTPGNYTANSVYRTVTRDSDSSTELQIVIPVWRTDDEIYADQPTGKTGITVSGEELEWMDTNRDSRKWAEYY